jgi:FkbM family methyltransferase
MKYGDALPDGFEIPSSGFWLKNDLTPEGNPFRLIRLRDGDRVMDCGLFVGTFTAACLEQGAAAVRSYEAAPKNAVLAKKNLARYGEKVTLVEAALVATEVTSVTLNLAAFSGANTIVAGKSKKSLNVPAVNFRRELLEFKPTVLKLDVEGAEYDLLDSLKPGDLASVRSIFIEFHPIDKRAERIRTIQRFIEDEGFVLESSKLRAFVASRDARTLFSE